MIGTELNLPNLRHLITEEDVDPTMAMRSFNSRRQFKEPSDNWNMGIETPAWVMDIHNKYTGRCFILGTGPSLAGQLPLLRHLNGEHTFTCNRMRSWGELPFVPYVHCITEPGPVIDFGRLIAPKYDFPEAQNRVACMWWPVRAKGWLWLPKAPDDIQVRWQGCFGMDETLPPLPSAWASPLTIAQFALWMGFTEIVLLGVDTTQEGQAWDPIQGRTQKARNIRSILECADRMRSQIWLGGRKIWDATPGGRMNKEGVLPYRALEDVLEVKA